MSAARVLRRLPVHAREDGPLSVLASCLDWGARWAAGAPRAHGPSARTFAFDGRDVPYYWHRYNHTWLNERAVEIALAAEVMAQHGGQRTVEVGNVLPHYFPSSHVVVDKYERADGVLNADVVDVVLDEPVDLLVSISTLEHVGKDEPEKDPEKAKRAIWHLASLLAPGGRMWVTIPVGYNHPLDQQLRTGELPFTDVKALRRVSAGNDWEQVALDDVWGATYDRLLFTAHGLVVAELVREP